MVVELGCWSRYASTAVEYAVRSKDTVLVNMLSQSGARPSIPFLRTTLLQAARDCDMRTLELLHSMRADLSVSNYDKVCFAVTHVMCLPVHHQG